MTNLESTLLQNIALYKEVTNQYPYKFVCHPSIFSFLFNYLEHHILYTTPISLTLVIDRDLPVGAFYVCR